MNLTPFDTENETVSFSDYNVKKLKDKLTKELSSYPFETEKSIKSIISDICYDFVESRRIYDYRICTNSGDGILTTDVYVREKKTSEVLDIKINIKE